MTDAAFTPTMPARPDDWLGEWTLFFGERYRDVLTRWPRKAFEELYHFVPGLIGRYHIVSDPEAVQQVLLERRAVYIRPRIIHRILGPFMGESLFMAEGEPWREQRRVMAPAFTPAAIEGFMPLFQAAGRSVAERWGAAGGRIDVSVEATRATFEVVSRALFSGEDGLSSEETCEHMAAAMAAVAEVRVGALLGLHWLDVGKVARRGEASRRFIAERFMALIERRQAMTDPPADFVTRLLSAFAETHDRKAAAKLAYDNAVTFFGAGHETTAGGLTWSLYLLSQAPAVQERCRAEARAALAAGGTSAETLAALPYLRQVWDEALRLYPPAPRIEREAAADDDLCGHPVKKGDLIAVNAWVIHRHRKLWRSPDRFDPENFSPEAKASRHRFQYLPFGAGPRICIGMAFANAEGPLILAEWLAGWRFAPEPGHEVEAASTMTIRPRGGLPLRIEPAP